MSRFETTQWSLVIAAGDTRSEDSREALAALCEVYWYPLYVYARRRGQDAEKAQDLTQGFFAKLVEKNYLQAADRDRGKFRTFLLTAFQRFMADEWDRERAQKRGGGQAILSLDFENAEGEHYGFEPADERTPEDDFDACWAATLMDRARDRMRREMLEPGKEERFELLEGFVTGEGEDIPYRQVAETLGLSEAAVKVAVHRMRKRFGEILRAEVAETVGDPDEVDVEVRHVLSAVGGAG